MMIGDTPLRWAIIVTASCDAICIRLLSCANSTSSSNARAYYAMAGIKPKDEAEGMIAALLVASYNASMDCYRRAAIDNQTPQARQENLTVPR
jgi:hypothetical protein